MNTDQTQKPTHQKELAQIRAWHRPRDPQCAQNGDPDADCTCLRQCQRKPYRVVRVEDHSAPVGTRKHNPKLVLSLWPNGVIKIREHGCRREYALTASSVFIRVRYMEAMRVLGESAARRGKGKAKKKRAGGATPARRNGRR